MIIRATKKLLNTSRIQPIKNLNESKGPFPGEWYVGLVPTGRPGSMLIHFLLSSTKLSIICQAISVEDSMGERGKGCGWEVDYAIIKFNSFGAGGNEVNMIKGSFVSGIIRA